MHEISILSNVMDVVLKYAKESNAREVVSVTLVVGELRDVVDELMKSCFQFLCRNIIAKDAALHMEKVPLKAQCNQCRLVFPADIIWARSPQANASRPRCLRATCSSASSTS